MNIRRIKKIFLIIYLVFCNRIYSQVAINGLPFITNFTKKEYRFHNQNWAIEEDNNGLMFFGNTNGLMYFNGYNWSLTDEDDAKEKAYSIAKDNYGRIYVGYLGEFGYIQPTIKGSYKFISLSAKYKKETEGILEVWSTYCIGSCTYFCTRNKIFKFQNDELIKVYEPESGNTYHKFFIVNGKLLVRENSSGFKIEVNNKLQKVSNSEVFAEIKVDFILPYHDGGFLIGTRNKGFYKWSISNEENTFSPIKNEISTKLQDLDVYCGLLLHDGNYIIGTHKSGAFILDKNLQVKFHFSKTLGLNDNKVLYLFQDRNKNIWLALDKGISFIEYDSPFLRYNESFGLVGNINSCAIKNDSLIVATSQGLQIFDKKTDKFNTIYTEEFNYLYTFKTSNHQKLLTAFKNGAGIIKANKQFELIPETEGVECYYLYQPKGTEELYIGGKNYLAKFNYLNNKFAQEFEFDGILGTVKSIISKDNQVYVGLEDFGVMVIPDKNENKIELVTDNTQFKLSKFFVFNFDNNIYFTTSKGVYQIHSTNNFQKANLFCQELVNKSEGIFRIKQDENNRVWLNFPNYNIQYTGFFNGQTKICKNINYLPFMKMYEEQINDFYFDQKFVWLCTNSGLYKYNLQRINNSKEKASSLIFRVSSTNDSALFLGNYIEKLNNRYYVSKKQPETQIPTIPFKNNFISFEYSSTFYKNLREVYFQTHLENYEDNYSNWSKDHKRSFSNLSGGKYIFHVKAKDENGNISTETTYTFYIESPWYQTGWGITLVLVLSIGTIGFVAIRYSRFKTKRIEAEKKVLEEKVTERTYELELSNQEVLNQKNNLETKNKEIDHKNKEITQSIEYALHIQQSILPDTDAIYANLKNSFVLYKPKDIVSGDFFAFTTYNQNSGNSTDCEIIIAAADCTGHGVPGALMSMLGSNILYQIINEKKLTKPSDILYHLNIGVNESLKQNINEGNDGMDIVLCNLKFDGLTQTYSLQYSGAYRPLYYIKDGALEEIKATKTPIGGIQSDERIYINHEFTLQKGDTLYLTTDGYADQFGGDLGKKMTTKKFKEYLVSIQNCDMDKQGKLIDEYFENWRGNNEQVDDVCVIGIRV